MLRLSPSHDFERELPTPDWYKPGHFRRCYVHITKKPKQYFKTLSAEKKQKINAIFAALDRHQETEIANHLTPEQLAFYNEHYVAAPPYTAIPRLMDEFLNYLKQFDKENRNPFALADFSHRENTSIHSFGNANGRSARLLMNIILMKKRKAPVLFDLENYLTMLRTDDPGLFAHYLEILSTNHAKFGNFTVTIDRQNAMSAEIINLFDSCSVDNPDFEAKIEKLRSLCLERLSLVACVKCSSLASSEHNYKKCSACRSSAYCSKECQLQDWPRHKKCCGLMKQLL